MSMTLRDLRYFLALADEMHFGRAAQSCFVSQPTLSAGIRRLEHQLGVQLFERTNRSVRISDAGAALLGRAQRLVRDAEELREHAQDLRDPLGGVLRLGVIPTVGPYLLPHLMPSVRTMLPHLSIRLHERVTDELLADLRGGALDVALLSDPFDDDGLRTAPVFDEPFILALPAAHELCKCREVAVADLDGVDVLLLAEGHCMRDQVSDICGAADPDTRSTFSGTTLETLRNMVAAGAGCTLLPALAAHPAQGITTRPFGDPKPSRRISLAWRTTFSRRLLIQRLADMVRSCTPDAVRAVG